MNNSVDDYPFDDNSLKLIESLINMHKDLVFVFYNNKPILFNKASQVFFGVDTLKLFAREFGTLENRFVPHDAYFHTSKIDDGQTWQQSIMALDESERIISMLDHKIKPHAFSVSIEKPVNGCELIVFSDITTDLIKRIMTENKTNLDTDTQAYNRQYFEHITARLVTAATYNEKYIGTVLIELEKSDSSLMQSLAEGIKANIRDDDMLVRWSEKSFLLVFLIASEEHADSFGRKIVETINKFQTAQKTRVCMSVQRDQESVEKIILRCETLLMDSEEIFSIA